MTTDLLLSASQKKKKTLWTITTGATGNPGTYGDWSIGYYYGSYGSVSVITVNDLTLTMLSETSYYGPGTTTFSFKVLSPIDLTGKTLIISSGGIDKEIILTSGSGITVSYSNGTFSYFQTLESNSNVSQFNIPYPGTFTAQLKD